jgi:hypothetical protein
VAIEGKPHNSRVEVPGTVWPLVDGLHHGLSELREGPRELEPVCLWCMNLDSSLPGREWTMPGGFAKKGTLFPGRTKTSFLPKQTGIRCSSMLLMLISLFL